MSLTVMLTAGLLTVCACAAEAASPAPRTHDVIHWVFLNSGTNRTPRAKEIAEKEQEEHVGNLGRLGKLGQGLMAGPLGDNGFIRGTVVLNLPPSEDVMTCFQPDPFVQGKRLAVEHYVWIVNSGRLGKPREPFVMAEHVLGVVKKGPAWKPGNGVLHADTLQTWIRALKAMADSGDYVLSGPLVDAGDKLGIIFFGTGDLAKVRTALDGDPALKSGKVVVELHPQWTAAGVLGD